MKMTIDAGMMKDMFKNYDRDYFTYEACEAINKYYDEVDPDVEFDPIAICCDWSEYGDTPCLTWQNLFDDYGYLLKNEYDEEELDKMNEDEKRENLINILEDETMVIRLSDSVLVAAF